jgi:DNA-binding transcriptional LysR family regulator
VADTSLVARPLGALHLVNCASPLYLKKHGTPLNFADMAQHQSVHFVSTLGARTAGFGYPMDGSGVSLSRAEEVTVNNAGAFETACLAGLRIIQVPLVAIKTRLQTGDLVEVLPHSRAQTMPFTLLYANRSHLSKGVRVVTDYCQSSCRQRVASCLCEL